MGIRWVEPQRGGRRGSLELTGRIGGERTWTLHGGEGQRGLEASTPIDRALATESTLEGLSGALEETQLGAGRRLGGEGRPPARRGLTGRSHAWRRSGQMPVWLWVGSPRSGSGEFPPRWPSPCRSHGYCGRRHCRRAGGARGPFWCSGLPGGWGCRRPQAPALLGPGKARRWRV